MLNVITKTSILHTHTSTLSVYGVRALFLCHIDHNRRAHNRTPLRRASLIAQPRSCVPRAQPPRRGMFEGLGLEEHTGPLNYSAYTRAGAATRV